ncbi:molybdopterin converting factor small subunit [Compostimonas suwonensis]|uniref:Molybdopterin converting factor small subunit n=1 Tax=Compostimonas suwonensis TaxID=1048394 RepID=A0A2M9BU46_9MICO|nr:molybdopterin converting factor small subunit [Compostimonas suwonensis]
MRYFAAAEEAAGGLEQEAFEFAPDATLAELHAELVRRHGEPMARVLRSGSFLVDGIVRRGGDARLGPRVDVLPPFAGG